MQYRKDTFHNIFIRLNDDGSTLMIKAEMRNGDIWRSTRVVSYDPTDWSEAYHYLRSDKREFDEAEKNARI